MKHPKISIIVAAYKSENVIRETLKQLLSIKNAEVIAAVDTHEDKTIDIVKEFAKKHKNLIVDFSEKRRGIIKAFNSALKKAHGEIAIKFDADRRFFNPATIFNRLIKHYKDPNVGAVTFDMKDPPEYSDKKIAISRLVKAQGFMSQIVSDWRKEKYPIIKGNFDMPLIVHSFRKTLVSGIDVNAINDDAEIGYIVLDKGYKAVFAKDIFQYGFNEPANLLNVFYRQRRTRIGWLKTAKRRKINFKKYYASLLVFLLFNFYKYDIYDLVSLLYFAFAYTIALIGAFFKINEKITKIWR